MSHNSSICNRNVHICAHFCYKTVHCGIFADVTKWCIVGYKTGADLHDKSVPLLWSNIITELPDRCASIIWWIFFKFCVCTVNIFPKFWIAIPYNNPFKRICHTFQNGTKNIKKFLSIIHNSYTLNEWVNCMCQDLQIAHWCQQHQFELLLSLLLLLFFYLLFPCMVVISRPRVRVAVEEFFAICYRSCSEWHLAGHFLSRHCT